MSVPAGSHTHVPVVVPDPAIGHRGCSQVAEWPSGEERWSCTHVTACEACGAVLTRYSTRCPDKPAGLPYDWWKARLNDDRS